ncbi:hypothetical protein [Paraglaciecola sp. 25GB23A]|uniref:hypothetical protein n=1 Tax=Paraglaciecola sp. 25GB23A TaxID=3156068 RepID=UPI0032AF3F0A
MNINHKTSAMLFLSALCLVFSVLLVSPNVPHSDSIAPSLESVEHSQPLTVKRFAVKQFDYKQVKLFTAVKQIGSLDPVTHNQTHNDSVILLPFFIRLAGDAFAPPMLENYQHGVQVYMSHQQQVWHKIKRPGLIKLFNQQYEALDILPNSIFA